MLSWVTRSQRLKLQQHTTHLKPCGKCEATSLTPCWWIHSHVCRVQSVVCELVHSLVCLQDEMSLIMWPSGRQTRSCGFDIKLLIEWPPINLFCPWRQFVSAVTFTFNMFMGINPRLDAASSGHSRNCSRSTTAWRKFFFWQWLFKIGNIFLNRSHKRCYNELHFHYLFYLTPAYRTFCATYVLWMKWSHFAGTIEVLGCAATHLSFDVFWHSAAAKCVLTKFQIA